MGGDPAGNINHDQHDFALWEKRVDALMVLASSAGLMNTDSLRRVLEDMGEEAYETMSYYERWIASVSQNMVEAGAFSTAELADKMAQVKDTWHHLWRCDMKVRVQNHWPPGHIRTPAYLRGKTGEIEREIGLFNNPEQNAYRLPPQQRRLVRVRFTMAEIWGDAAETPDDVIEAEIYAHWLEPA